MTSGRMSLLGLLLSFVLAFLQQGLSAAATQPATTRAAATQPGGFLLTTPIPNTNWTLSISCPPGWKVSRYRSGQIFLYKPGTVANTLEARWEFSLKKGMKGANLEGVLKDAAAVTGRAQGATVLRQEMTDRPHGIKAGVLEFRSTAQGIDSTTRQYFFVLDPETALAVTEFALTPQWKADTAPLDAITDSLTVKATK